MDIISQTPFLKINDNEKTIDTVSLYNLYFDPIDKKSSFIREHSATKKNAIKALKDILQLLPTSSFINLSKHLEETKNTDFDSFLMEKRQLDIEEIVLLWVCLSFNYLLRDSPHKNAIKDEFTYRSLLKENKELAGLSPVINFRKYNDFSMFYDDKQEDALSVSIQYKKTVPIKIESEKEETRISLTHFLNLVGNRMFKEKEEYNIINNIKETIHKSYQFNEGDFLGNLPFDIDSVDHKVFNNLLLDVFLPPIEDTVFEALKKENIALIREIRRQFKDIHSINYSNPNNRLKQYNSFDFESEYNIFLKGIKEKYF